MEEQGQGDSVRKQAIRQVFGGWWYSSNSLVRCPIGRMVGNTGREKRQ